MRLNIFICLLLAGITLMVYWPAGSYEAVYYDDTSFTENPEVQSGLNGHSFIWAMSGVVAANWHPVTSLSFVLGHQFWGFNPGAEHLANVIFHALNAVLLFLVLEQMTRLRPEASTPDMVETRGREARLTGRSALPYWRCAVVAALFAWHPLRVESVAWIAERKDVLCAFFFFLTLLAWGRYAQNRSKAESRGSSANISDQALGSRRWTLDYYLALVFFALGLMSKAMLVTVPFVLLLLDFWPLGRVAGDPPSLRFGAASKHRISSSKTLRKQLSTLLLEKWPFFVLTAVFSVITFVVQHHDAATPSLAELGPGIRLENVIASYLRYLAWTVWPANLAVYYSFPFDSHFYLALWPDWEIGAAALILVLVTVLCVGLLNRKPYLAVGWFWYLGTMVPVIGLVQVGSQGMADRYTYIPLIGPVISLVWLVSEKWGSRFFPKLLFTILIPVILAASILQTRHQLQFWKNTDILFRHTVEVTGENPRAEYILGLGLEHEGRINEAMVHYRNAMTSQPRVKGAFCAMARLLGQRGQWTETAQTYFIMLQDDPNDFNAHLGLATALPHLGRMAEAEIHLQAAVQNCPDEPDALNNLAWTLAGSENAELRDGSKAVKYAERACELTGHQETTIIGTLAAAYAEAGRFDDAISTAQKACDLAAKKGETNLAQRNQELLERYRAHQTANEE